MRIRRSGRDCGFALVWIGLTWPRKVTSVFLSMALGRCTSMDAAFARSINALV